MACMIINTHSAKYDITTEAHTLRITLRSREKKYTRLHCFNNTGCLNDYKNILKLDIKMYVSN